MLYYCFSPKNRGRLRSNPVSAAYLSNDLTAAARRTAPCYWLRSAQKQFNQCRTEQGLASVLNDSRYLTIQHCEDQFRYDRWNCSHTKSMFKKVFRETAFMYALHAAGLTITTARACADGKLKKCNCSSKEKRTKENMDNIDESYINVKKNWRWGGCGDNLQYGRRFTRKFLQLRSPRVDFQDSILNHNSDVGIRAVASQMREVCKCHGVSGSCSVKTCWRRVPPIMVTATYLKKKYHRAVKFEFGNRPIRKADPRNRKWPKGQLLYLEKSPTFCSVTPNRKCLNRDNCVTLCCGRGFISHSYKENRHCNCRWKKNFEMICDQCSFEVKEHICK